MEKTFMKDSAAVLLFGLDEHFQDGILKMLATLNEINAKKSSPDS